LIDSSYSPQIYNGNKFARHGGGRVSLSKHGQW
jgi:hypothetical protein